MKTLLLSLSMLAAGQAALAQPWSFTKIVDSKTVIPGSTEKFDGPTSFQYVSVYGDRVAFRGMSKSAASYGVYEWRNGVGRAVANQGTIAPGTTSHFFGYQDVNATADGPTFYGGNNDNNGLFRGSGNQIVSIADRFSQVPDHGGVFRSIRPAHHTVGNSTVFGGSIDSTGTHGIYRSDDGVLSRIADKTMSPPGHAELFNRFDDWGIDGQNTYFTAETSGYQCIIRNTLGAFTTIVDTTMSLSDGRALAAVGGVHVGRGGPVFEAYTADNTQFLAMNVGGLIQPLVDASSDPPGPSAGYQGINQIDFQDGTLVFGANDLTIYTNYGGTLQRLVGPGDVLDGKVVTSAFFYDHGFDGTTAAFWVTFQGDSSFGYDRAIYTVTIPAPGATGLAFFSVLAKFFRRRRVPGSLLRALGRKSGGVPILESGPALAGNR